MHNEEKFKLIHHFLYEWRLGKYFEKRLKKQINNRQNLKTCRSYITDVKGFVEKKHKEYTALRRTMSHDAAYSVSVCTAVALHITACTLANEEVAFSVKTA